MTTAAERVCAEAMTWLGTPYKPCACVKGVGVDCALFLRAVFDAAGVIGPLEIEHYSSQWHMHHPEEKFLAYVRQAGGVQVDRSQVQRGDVGVWKYGLTHSHGGIVLEAGDDLLVIHSHIKARRGVTLCRETEYPLSAAEGATFWRIVA